MLWDTPVEKLWQHIVVEHHHWNQPCSLRTSTSWMSRDLRNLLSVTLNQKCWQGECQRMMLERLLKAGPQWIRTWTCLHCGCQLPIECDTEWGQDISRCCQSMVQRQKNTYNVKYHWLIHCYLSISTLDLSSVLNNLWWRLQARTLQKWAEYIVDMIAISYGFAPI